MVLQLEFNKSLLPEPTFWEKHGYWISSVIAAILIIAFIVYLYLSIAESHKVSPKKKAKQPPMCQVTLISHSIITTQKGTEFIAPFPKKDGYEFGGWFYDSACTEPYKNKILKKDLTLYPKWIKHS